jgi:hypothetical protein
MDQFCPFDNFAMTRLHKKEGRRHAPWPHGADKVEVARAGGEPRPATVTELTPLGPFATWQAERAIGDHDRSTLRLRLDPGGDPTALEPGMTVWLRR